jgi:hypothetical protein
MVYKLTPSSLDSSSKVILKYAHSTREPNRVISKLDHVSHNLTFVYQFFVLDDIGNYKVTIV